MMPRAYYDKYRNLAPRAKDGRRRKALPPTDDTASDASSATDEPEEGTSSPPSPEPEEPNCKLPEEVLKTLYKPPGVLLIAGQVSWDLVAKRENTEANRSRPNLYVFHKFTDLKFRFVASACSAAHSVLVSENGEAYTFGRNPHGQLGFGDTTTRNEPTLVPELAGKNIIHAAVGRHHTLFVTDTGAVYACGENKTGQCGIGKVMPRVLTPTRVRYSGPSIVKVGCGAEFSMILDCEGGLHSFGLPEYGQLGHNTDGSYFVTSTKLSFHYELSPKRITRFCDKSRANVVKYIDDVEIVDFSCGNNHTVAIDSKKRAFSWGFGGFGRLGHAVQKDEAIPRLIKFFELQSRGIRSVHCGATFSLAVNEHEVMEKTNSMYGYHANTFADLEIVTETTDNFRHPFLSTLFMFGQTKRTGEANMYPKPIQDLAGWSIRSVGTSNTSIVLVADNSLIAWGVSPTYGELGTGEINKSSARPKEVSRMEGLNITQVAMGYSHTLLLCDNSTEDVQKLLADMPSFVP